MVVFVATITSNRTIWILSILCLLAISHEMTTTNQWKSSLIVHGFSPDNVLHRYPSFGQTLKHRRSSHAAVGVGGGACGDRNSVMDSNRISSSKLLLKSTLDNEEMLSISFNTDRSDNHPNSNSSNNRRSFLHTFVVFGASICPMAVTTTSAALADDGDSGGIKTMDMSLPSYDTINTLKTSGDTERGLGVESDSNKSKSAKKSKQKSSSGSGGGGGGGGGNPLGSVLPSMNKSVTKQPKSSSSSSKSGSTAAAAAAKTTSDDSGIKTMDLSLPSYSDNVQGSEKKKSVFSI